MVRLIGVIGLSMSVVGCTGTSFHVESDIAGVAEYVGLAHAKVQSRLEPTCRGGEGVKVDVEMRSSGGSSSKTSGRYNFDFECESHGRYYR